MSQPPAGFPPARHTLPGTPAQPVPAAAIDSRTPARSELSSLPPQEPVPIVQRGGRAADDGKSAREPQARTKLARERLQKAWCDALLAPSEGDARDRASTDYLICLATEAPHLDDGDLAIETVQASALPADQRTMFAAALGALSAHEPVALARASRAVFCAVGTSVPTSLALRLLFDAARTLSGEQQRVLVNEYMRSQILAAELHTVAGSALYQSFFGEFRRRFSQASRGAGGLSASAVLGWMHEVLNAAQLHEPGLMRLGAHVVACLARCPAAAHDLAHALGRAAHLHCGSVLLGALCRLLATAGDLALAQRTQALATVVRAGKFGDFHLRAVMEALSDSPMCGTAAGALMVRSVVCALGLGGDAQAGETLRTRLRETGARLDDSAWRHLLTGCDLAIDPLRVLELDAATQALRFEQLQAVHADTASLSARDRQRLLRAYCVLPWPALGEALLRDALGTGRDPADDLVAILGALLPWATDGDRAAPPDKTVRTALELIGHARDLHPHASSAHRQAASQFAGHVETWSGAVLETERLEGRSPREGAGDAGGARKETAQMARLRSLQTAARLVREVAGRPAAPDARTPRESKAGDARQEIPQASHTTTLTARMSSSAASQHEPPAAESAYVLVYLHAQTADPATRAHELLTLFREASVPLDAAMCQMARDALVQHPQELPWREDKQGKASPLGPQYRTLTSRLLALYEYFLAGNPAADARGFAEGELAWAQRMNEPRAGNPLAGQLEQVIDNLRQRLGLQAAEQVD